MGLIGPIPLFAGLILVIFLSRGFSKLAEPKKVNLVLAILWAIFAFYLFRSASNTTANLISSILQIFFAYLYLQIADRLEDSIWLYLLFLVIGGYILTFLYILIYAIAGGK